MKKPILDEYGITGDEYDEYLIELECYRKAVRRNTVVCHLGLCIATVALYAFSVAAIVLGVTGSTDENNAGYIAVSCVFIIVGTIFLIINIVMTKRKSTVFNFRTKARYLDGRLESRCAPYDDAMKEYVSHIREINVLYWNRYSAEDLRLRISELLSGIGYTRVSMSIPVSQKIATTSATAIASTSGGTPSKSRDAKYSAAVYDTNGEHVLIVFFSPGEKVTLDTIVETMSASHEKLPDIVTIMYVSVSGYMFKTNGRKFRMLYKSAKKKNVELCLWEIDDVLSLSYVCGTLIYDA